MRFMKKKGDNSTLRTVWNDDKTKLLGVVGTFQDFLAVGVVEMVTEYSLDTWCCIPAPGNEGWEGVGETREQAISNTSFGKLRKYL